WVYGFPILMLVSLGMAFRDNPQERIAVDVVGAGNLDTWKEKLGDERFTVTIAPDDWQKRLQAGKTDLVIEVGPGDDGSAFRFWEEPRRAESRPARYAVDAALANRQARTPTKQLEQSGSRY